MAFGPLPIVARAASESGTALASTEMATFEPLGQDEIERARVFYLQRVDPALPDAERIFNWALVDVLIYGNRRVATHIW